MTFQTGASASSSSAAAASAAQDEDDGSALPSQLDGVPHALRAWWLRTAPAELERATLRSGRCDMLAHVARLLRRGERVLDLGCGPGLLAREAGRRDFLGVDMSPAMVRAARRWMDEVLPDNILDYYPSERIDTAVLASVLEPYPGEVRRLLLAHVFDFLPPGGRVVVAVAVRHGGLGSDTECGLDLVFPSACEAPGPDDIEEELMLAGFDVASAELVKTQTLNHTSVLPGEEPKAERRTYAVVIGRRAIVIERRPTSAQSK